MEVFLPHNTSLSGFEAELKRYLEDLDIPGYALMSFSIRTPRSNVIREVDALIFAQPGKIVCVEAKGYEGNWTGNANTEWISDGMVIQSSGATNPFEQVKRYGFIVKNILIQAYPPGEDFWINNIVVGRNSATFNIDGAFINKYPSDNPAAGVMLVCNLERLGNVINGIQVRRQLINQVANIGLFEIAAKVADISSEELRKLECKQPVGLPNPRPPVPPRPPKSERPHEHWRKRKVIGIPLGYFMLALATISSLAAIILILLSGDSRPQGEVDLTEIVPEVEITLAEIVPEEEAPALEETPSVICDEFQKTEEGNCYRDLARSTLVIGVLSSPDQYQPLADYLRAELGSDLMDVIVEGDSDLSYQEAKNQISQQNWDLVFAYSPMNSMAAHDVGYQWVARMFPEFPPFYQSVLYVRADSPINSITDLNSSHTIALNNFGSASGFYRPIYDLYGKTLRVIMQRGGGQIKELVLSGEADVGAGPLGVAEDDPELKIIHVSTDIPGSGFYLSPLLSPSDRERLTQILLSAPDEIRDQREGANYGEGVEPDWQEFRRISLRVEEIIQCRTFQEDPVPLFCPEDLPQTSIEGFTGTIKGYQNVDADTVRLNFFDTENQMHHLFVPVTTLSGVPNGQTPATINNKTVTLSNELVFENSAIGVPTASIEAADQIVVEVTN